MLGNGVAPIALAFAVLAITGSVTELGLVVAARTLFNVVFLLFGGVVADRLPRSLVLVGSSALSALSQGTVATLVLTHQATVPRLLVLSALNGTFGAFAFPASGALLPQTVAPDERTAANALNRLAANSAMIGGAALGGLVVAALGPGWGLAIDAITFACAGLLFAFVRVDAPARTAADEAKKPGVLHELREGWQEFAHRRWVWTIVLAFGFLNASFSAAIQVLGPSVAKASFGSGGWGVVLSSETVGMVVGGMIGLRFRPQRMLFVGTACMAADSLLPTALAFRMPLAVLAACGVVAGACVEQFMIAWETSLQQEIPEDRLARVYSYDALGSFALIPIAQAATGPLSAALGVRATLLMAAVLVVLCTAGMVAVPEVRTLRRRTPGATTAAAESVVAETA
ncbi:Predicted arabinose efflux permease, MFS family [Streptacidiphilus jiangxiensis]|uniref:Predicted arabinose efflux permease, MFS family n=2 Tax=Streptacidiphilus jiangxiensis TaxID=235985 RepID=A0A1H7YA01_STRJI|nr:Predicted arabinose efflux permease, MFS family [Streptacidiphilus jiangxiensis]